jgi:hypothetical protein
MNGEGAEESIQHFCKINRIGGVNSEERGSWENSIKIDSREIRCQDMDLIQLALHMVRSKTSVNNVMNLRVL